MQIPTKPFIPNKNHIASEHTNVQIHSFIRIQLHNAYKYIYTQKQREKEDLARS
jgi:hypothetical protein